MNPVEKYQQDLKKNGFQEDDQQLVAVNHTQRLYQQLLDHKPATIFSKLLGRNETIKGLYLWGGTGRGKTYLVDSFYECLQTEKKYRVHFHRFMLDIHERLEKLPKSPDPLVIIARQIADTTKVLCLDEFHVHDIADAMLLAGLLKPLFENGVVLVATSNIEIKNLYKNGLQRERFMYAIKLLQQYTEEVDLGEGTDYRFSILDSSENYSVLNDDNRSVVFTSMEKKFNELAPCKPKHNRHIVINNREINYRALADDLAWFDYTELCCTPRSAHDYIQIAERFSTIFISDIKQMFEHDDSAAKRFIHLIDAIYDHNVKLVVSAETLANELYQGQRLKFAFDRTISRLTEMGTQQYLHLEHNPAGSVRHAGSAL